MTYPQDAISFIQRIFSLAAQRVGGTVELGQHLGMTPSELGFYLGGEGIPPFHTLLKAVDLVVEQVNLADRPWQTVLQAYQTDHHL